MFSSKPMILRLKTQWRLGTKCFCIRHPGSICGIAIFIPVLVLIIISIRTLHRSVGGKQEDAGHDVCKEFGQEHHLSHPTVGHLLPPLQETNCSSLSSRLDCFPRIDVSELRIWPHKVCIVFNQFFAQIP